MPVKRKNKTASLRYEMEFYRAGYHHIFGVDEVGRGPWAGPITAGTVCLPLDDSQLSKKLKGVRDSKEMTATQRTNLVEVIHDVALAWGIGSATADEITAIGLTAANQLANQRALEHAQEQFPNIPIDYLFLDYFAWANPTYTRQLTLVGGDKQSLSIASASVLAKVWRDEYMIDIAEEFPQYGFENHKGYGTAQHLAALEKYGITPLHRQSFAPIQAIIQQQ